jgi:hypothetical protein
MQPAIRGAFTLPDAGASVALVSPHNSDWSVRLLAGDFSPAYGRKDAAPVVRCERDTTLPAELATVVLPSSENRAVGTLVLLQQDHELRSAIGYSYSVDQVTHRFFFATAPGIWSLDGWSSDAEFFYCREGRAGFELAIFCNGSHLSFKGERVLTAQQTVPRCELRQSGSSVIVLPENQFLVLHRWPQSTADGKSRLELEPARVGG